MSAHTPTDAELAARAERADANGTPRIDAGGRLGREVVRLRTQRDELVAALRGFLPKGRNAPSLVTTPEVIAAAFAALAKAEAA